MFLYIGELTSDEEEVRDFINDSERTFPNAEKQEVLKSTEHKTFHCCGRLNQRKYLLLVSDKLKEYTDDHKEQRTSESKTFSLFYCVVCI